MVEEERYGQCLIHTVTMMDEQANITNGDQYEEAFKSLCDI